MKYIIKLEEYGNRIKVYTDDGMIFVLYKGEVRKFNLEENVELSEESYKEITELLYKRAKERSLYILENSNKTAKQISDKLKQGLYPNEIIERVIAFLINYNFVNDMNYALMYIEYKASLKSRKQIVQELYNKGVSSEIIDKALSDSGFCDEVSLEKVISKRISKYDLNNKKDLQKFYQYLIGKGYGYSTVKNALGRYINIE